MAQRLTTGAAFVCIAAVGLGVMAIARHPAGAVTAGGRDLAPDWQALASHRAVYDLHLSGSEPSQDFARADGRFVLEWRKTCAGYTLNQRMVTEFVPFEGPAVFSDLQFTSWEAPDGESLQFSLENFMDGALSEEAAGTADRDTGQITFQAPGRDAQAIPKQTIFPSELTALLIAHARSGPSSFQHTVYDGAEDGQVMEATAFVGGAVPAPAVASGARHDALQGLESWPVTLSYFEPDPSMDLPAYQIAYRLYPNGISDDLSLDYGDFILVGELTDVTLLDTPDC